MLWAACCLGFFGFLRCGEFLPQNVSQFDPERHLTAADVAVDNHLNPTRLAVRIKLSKTDQFSHGTTIYIGKTSHSIFPVSAILQYLVIRPTSEGPLFVLCNSRPVTKQSFIESVRTVLTKAGVDPSGYKGHSFRIGAATTAAACGLSDGLIKTLGRWSSAAYQTYIKVPPQELASVAPMLVSQHSSGQS